MSSQEGAEELLRAFTSRDLSAIRTLADAGLDLDAPGGAGLTVLMRAVLRGQAVSVEWILSAGADPDVRTHDGKTALDFARQIDRPELVDLLIAAGAAVAAEAELAVGDRLDPPEPAAEAANTHRVSNVFQDELADRFDDAISDRL